MIKPRYIKSLTFLLLCNMALWDRKHSQLPSVGLVLVLFVFFFFELVKTETVKKKKKKSKQGNMTSEKLLFSPQDYSLSH